MPDGTVLLIDDEPNLRQVLSRVPGLEGYTVLQAPAARRGLETLQLHAAEVLVVLCDVKLPDANGVALCPASKPSAHRRNHPAHRLRQHR